MAQEYAFQSEEYGHAVKVQGKVLLWRVLFFSAIVVFSAGYFVLFTAVVKMPQVIAVLPILIYLAFLFFWRKLSYDCVTKAESGALSFFRMNGKKGKLMFSCRIKDIVYLHADTPDNRRFIISEYGTLPIASYACGADVTERLLAVAKAEERLCAFVFDSTDKVDRVIRYYNSALFEK